MIQVQCAGCGKRYAVPDNFGGKKMRCKQCSAVLEIPASTLASPASAPEAPPRPAVQPAEAEREESAQAEAPSQEAAPAPRVPGQKRFPGKKVPSFKRPAAPIQGARPAAAAPRKAFAVKKFQSKKLGSKPGVAGGAAGAGDEDMAAPAAKDSRKKLLPILGGAVALVALAAAIYYLFYSGGAPEPAAKKAPGVAEKKAANGESEEETTAEEEAKAAETALAAAASSQPLDPLAALPADANVLVRVAFGQIANNENLRGQIEALKSQEDMVQLIEDSGFDPMSHLRVVWAAGSASGLPSPAAGADAMDGGLILEGSFDRQKFLSGLAKNAAIGQNPRKQGSLEIYDVIKDGEKAGYMTFLSDEQVLFGNEAFFNKVIKVRDGAASLRSHKVFQDLTSDFGAANVFWAAFALTDEMKKSIADANKASEGKMPPIPALEGVLLTVDPSPDGAGMAIDLTARCPSPEEMQKAQQWSSGLVLMAKGMAPAEAKPLLDPVLKTLKVTPEGNNLRLSLEISGDLMKKVAELGGQTLGLPQLEEEEGEEEEAEEGEEESSEEEEAAEETPSEDMTEEEKAVEEEPAEEEEKASVEEEATEEEAPKEEAAEEEAPEEKAAEE